MIGYNIYLIHLKYWSNFGCFIHFSLMTQIDCVVHFYMDFYSTNSTFFLVFLDCIYLPHFHQGVIMAHILICLYMHKRNPWKSPSALLSETSTSFKSSLSSSHSSSEPSKMKCLVSESLSLLSKQRDNTTGIHDELFSYTSSSGCSYLWFLILMDLLSAYFR